MNTPQHQTSRNKESIEPDLMSTPEGCNTLIKEQKDVLMKLGVLTFNRRETLDRLTAVLNPGRQVKLARRLRRVGIEYNDIRFPLIRQTFSGTGHSFRITGSAAVIESLETQHEVSHNLCRYLACM